jgi:hypothetical protein
LFISNRIQKDKTEGRREGVKSGRGRLDQRKPGSGIKGRDDKSNGIQILMTEAFTKMFIMKPRSIEMK